MLNVALPVSHQAKKYQLVLSLTTPNQGRGEAEQPS
jgi:hypothetical protein